MKVRISKDFKVELNTLIKLEWKKFYPVLIIHERFEKIVKWIIRLLAIIGVLSCLITFQNKCEALLFSVIIVLIQQFFERVIFEYTTIIVSPLPNFRVDLTQWLTNAFFIPLNADGSYNRNETAVFAPCFRDEEYGIQLFKFLKQWNFEQDNDIENNIIISFIIEPNAKYSTYIYHNPKRKNIEKILEDEKEKNKLSKYGKRQQQLIASFIFGKKLDFITGSYIEKFLEFQEQNKLFYFMPSHPISDNGRRGTSFLRQATILKYNFKLKNRNELTRKDIEYHFPL
ncbi:hypothetical protein M2451_004071 [Dysgonomonas sp. PFB1-18]|uniref:hypothetical protein n=1 Tax=unclassified Dysgonomonas TaxID=2630389 RepID=UPI0024739968|nr:MULTISPECIES: hypothetical protein [unclassified Dysgonomonas]MDH6310890.1 hypothetical protein [Dysgonomonas sp. PF1-14]MDH6341041.1 hypothetical protein [Dysgonomonas sp. PF1-16]MDH6382724.1 hypothetical protein [Dysgonomonas sp. PFB1-18]MDH6400013.1 hypothetical protein [Dysgonomonas sp. PF1-23]